MSLSDTMDRDPDWRAVTASRFRENCSGSDGPWCAEHGPSVRPGCGLKPALAGITGGWRWWTVSTISRVSIPCK
jgi:hypothetical protein